MFDIANVSVNVVILLLRVSVLFLLYFFLWQVLRVVTRDMRGSGAALANDEASPHGQLVILSSGQTGLPVGKAFALAPATSIGRSLDNDIALNDTFLSAQHARLELRGTEWVLEDAGSTNGTFLNGFEVRGSTSVNPGDIVRIGRIEMKLVR